MPQRRNTKRQNSAEYTNHDEANNKWTVTEQSVLKSMLDSGIVNLSDPASRIKDADPIFERFSNNVIGYHLGVLRKQKLTSGQPRSIQNGVVASVNDVLTQYGVAPSNSASVIHNVEPDASNVRSNILVCDNMPVLRFSYMKYATKQEKIVVILDLPGGSQRYDWEFNEQGDAINIVFDWSKALYDVGNLFRSSLDANIVTMDDPKLHAMQNEVLKQGYSSKHIPKSRFHVDLGKRVHKDDGTWRVDSAQHQGNKVLIFEFAGFQVDSLKTEKQGRFF